MVSLFWDETHFSPNLNLEIERVSKNQLKFNWKIIITMCTKTTEKSWGLSAISKYGESGLHLLSRNLGWRPKLITTGNILIRSSIGYIQVCFLELTTTFVHIHYKEKGFFLSIQGTVQTLLRREACLRRQLSYHWHKGTDHFEEIEQPLSSGARFNGHFWSSILYFCCSWF